MSRPPIIVPQATRLAHGIPDEPLVLVSSWPAGIWVGLASDQHSGGRVWPIPMRPADAQGWLAAAQEEALR